jgi:hypothetical protein
VRSKALGKSGQALLGAHATRGQARAHSSAWGAQTGGGRTSAGWVRGACARAHLCNLGEPKHVVVIPVADGARGALTHLTSHPNHSELELPVCEEKGTRAGIRRRVLRRANEQGAEDASVGERGDRRVVPAEWACER